MTRTAILGASVALLFSAGGATLAQVSLGTVFTYQGKLENAGAPANGPHDFRFRLYSALAGGTQIAPEQCADNVPVDDGVFTLGVDFGAGAFNGDERYLEVDVRADAGADCSSPAGFVTLAPRQAVSATPYALQTRGIRVDPAGNVGIGTPTPLHTLHVVGDLRQDGRVALGNEGIFGADLVHERIFDFTHRITDFTTAAFFWAPWYSSIQLDPVAPVTQPVIGHLFEAEIPSTNAQPFGSVTGAVIYGTQRSGTGVIQSLNGASIFAGSRGDVTNQIGLSLSSDAFGSNDITDNRGLTIRTGHRTAGGSVGSDYGVYVHAPSRTSPLGSHYGIYLANRGLSFPNTWALYADGGRSYFRDAVGIGTSAPQSPLQVVGGVDAEPASGGQFVLGDTAARNLAMDADEIMARDAGGIASLAINASGGNVGIGTATPGATLHVSGGSILCEGDISARHPTDPNASVFLGWGPDASGFDVARIRIAGNPPNASNGLDIQRPGNISLMRITHDGDVTTRRNLHVGGTLTKAAGAFRIDHPLDPANKYLYHSFVESPDMKNLYDGVAVTDERGYATITMPEWFEALNRDFRYQLTVIDGADSDDFVLAKVVREIAERTFTIRTSRAGVRVSWQVTGTRRDAWAEANRIPTEEEKPAHERGKHPDPELHGRRTP